MTHIIDSWIYNYIWYNIEVTPMSDRRHATPINS